MRRKAFLFALLVCLSFPFSASAQRLRPEFHVEPGYEEVYANMIMLVSDGLFESEYEKMLEEAHQTSDTYLECLTHYLMLKNYRRLNVKITDVSHIDDVVVEAELTKNIARQNGYDELLFFAYFDEIAYHLSKKMSVTALEATNEMHAEALERDSKVGQFLAYRCFITISTSRKSDEYTKIYLRKAIDLAVNYLPEQSIVNMCRSMVNFYPVGSDSANFYLNLAEKHAKYTEDTSFVYRERIYYSSKNNDRKSFEKYLKLLNDFYRNHNLTIPPGTQNIITLHQYALDGKWEAVDSIVGKFSNKHTRLKYDYQFALARKDSSRALRDLVQINEIEDSIRVSTSSHDILEMTARFEIDQYKNQLDQKEQVITSLEKKNSIFIYLTVICLIISLLIILVIKQFYSNISLKKANGLKTAFIQNMSHEIRTPLNSIVGFSQLLSLPDGFITEEEKEEYGKHIVNNSNMLTMLIDDILNISDIERGGYKISFEECRLNDICSQALNTVTYRVPAGVELRRETDVEDDFTVVTDGRRVQQVIINYLTNACKHTTEGEIVLKVSTKENPGMITFSVTDTGTGVPPEKAEFIFGRFVQLDNFTQGSGLGLNICRVIAEKLDGEVKLDTTYKDGARFIFMIPNKR